jgi:hypothetical protein
MPFQLVLEEIKPEQVLPALQNVLGSAPGRILRFKNAVYARVERNKNGDQISEQGAQELAATIALQPIDEEHNLSKLVGHFEEGRPEGATVLTDGIIYASRFPDIAKGLATGEYQFSLEATAKEAECSICHGIYASEKEYCEHLQNRNTFQASRILRGLKATGGAVTKRPAGTDTKADPEQMEFVANFVMAKDLQPEPVLSFGSESAYNLWRKQPDNTLTAKVLDADDRKKLDTDQYALVQHKDSKTLRRFPINDCVHAQNALARVGQGKDMSDAERAEVKSKAEAKLNSLECKRETKAAASLQSIIGMGMYDAGDLTSGTPGGIIPPVLSPMMYKAEPDPEAIAKIVQAYLDKNVPQGNAVTPAPAVAVETVVQASIDPRSRMGGLSISADAKPKLATRKLEIPLH